MQASLHLRSEAERIKSPEMSTSTDDTSNNSTELHKGNTRSKLKPIVYPTVE